MNNPDIKSEYHVDKASGQRYIITKLGGALNNQGDDVGEFKGEVSLQVSDQKVRVAVSVGSTGKGDTWKIPAIDKAFQVVIPSGATGSVDIEGSVDGVNFETLATVAATGVYVNQQPIPFWRADIKAVASLPASVFTTVSITQLEWNGFDGGASNLISQINDAGTWYEWSGTGIGATILAGDYAQLNVTAAGQTKTDWTNIPFVIYEVVDANTVRVFDPTGTDRAVADTAIGMFPLLAVIAAY